MLEEDLVIGPVDTIGLTPQQIHQQDHDVRELVDWYTLALAAEETALVWEETDDVAPELRDARWHFRRRSLELMYVKYMGIRPAQRQEFLAMVKQSLAAGGNQTLSQIKALLGGNGNIQSSGSFSPASV